MASVRKLRRDDPQSPWVVEYTDQSGKRRRSTPKSGLKRDAEKMRVQIEADVERGLHVPDSQTVTVAQAVDLWLEACERRLHNKDNLRPQTMKNWRSYANKHVKGHIGHLLASKLTIPQVNTWLEELAYKPNRPLKFATLQGVLMVLRLVMTNALDRGLIAHNVLRGAKVRIPGREPPPVAIPTKAVIAQILEEATKNRRGRPASYLQPMIQVAVFAGLRMGEIRALQWENVDFAKNMILVRFGMDTWGNIDEPKTRAGIRDVPMPPNLSAELKRWHLANGRPESGLCFKTSTGSYVKDTALSLSWCRMQHAVLGGEFAAKHKPRSHFHFHSLRHVYASLLIESGLPPKRIQYLMGHKSIQMTFDRYGHLFEDPDLVRDAMTRVGASIVA